MRSPANISLLSLGLALVPAFIFWVGRQERLKHPALIPHALWRNKVFTSICINVFLTWGAFNAFEQILSFFFQDVQRLSALQAALRFLPAPISGVLINLIMGLIIHRVRADWIVITAPIISCIAPLLMAIVNPQWLYWACAFPAIFLNPMAEGALFTTSNLLITSVFPEKTQALAGGVFNTISQIGKSVSLALASLIANNVTARSSFEAKFDCVDERLSGGFLVLFCTERYHCLRKRLGVAKDWKRWDQEGVVVGSIIVEEYKSMAHYILELRYISTGLLSYHLRDNFSYAQQARTYFNFSRP